MEEHFILYLTLFSGIFLVLTTFLLSLSKKITSIPYTVALLLAGFLSQQIVHFFGLHFELVLSADVIYHILLPILLFESAFNINIHQFKIQFKTISFIATVGLLMSIFVVGAFLAYTIGLPLNVALLFGALISATDPIAVIALFKNLGGPKRLGLLADGESMFNDATGVIAFKLVATFVIGAQAFSTDKLFASLGNFMYVFVGSMVIGAIAGYLVSLIFKKLAANRTIITMITIAFTFLVFNGAEFFFALSGVIAIVVASIVLGNFGKPKVTGDTIHFLAEFWENLGFFCISLVFFFATFNLDIGIFSEVPALHIAAAIIAVLLARAVSVYLSCFITNNMPFFNDEPNVPMSWQHILNWGGLRGVIPLVLVYSLPQDFEYYNEMLAFTLGALLFTLLVNGLSIKFLLTGLKLHLPEKEEEIIGEETNIFTIEELKEKLKAVNSGYPQNQFNTSVISEVEKELDKELEKHKKHLQELANDPELLMRSFKIQAIQIERMTAHELHEKGYVNEQVFMEFDTELDLQQDALEYPDVKAFRGQTRGGKIKSRTSFRRLIRKLNEISKNYPFLRFIVRSTEEDAIEDRFMLLKLRLISSADVLWYLDYIKKFAKDNTEVLAGIETLAKEHSDFIADNEEQLKSLIESYPEILNRYQKRVIYSILEPQGHNH